MKCPKCGENIPESAKFCLECGARLLPASQSDDAVTDTNNDKAKGKKTLFDELMEDIDTSSRRVPAAPYDEDDEDDEDDIDADDLLDAEEDDDDDDDIIEECDEVSAAPIKDKKKNTRVSADTRSAQMTKNGYSWQDDDDVFDSDDEEDDVKMARRGNAAFWIVTVVLILLIGALCYVWLQKNYNGSPQLLFAEWFGDSPITLSATLEQDETKDGDPAIRITVYARNGCIVRFEEGSTVSEYEVTDHCVAIRVPVSLWIPAEPESNVLSITPTVFVVDPANNYSITKIEFDKPIEIEVPSVTIDLVLPETHELETSNNTVEIAGYVSDTTASVFMGETQLQINENGYFRGIYHLTEFGTHTVYIQAIKSGHEVGKTKLTITYTKSAIAPVITSESLRTFEDTIEITGTMEKGAALTIEGIEFEGEPVIDSENGTFSFVAKVPNVGLYTPTLTLTKDNVTSPTDIYIEHAPEREDYVSSAWACDYEWIVDHPTMTNKHFRIGGKVVEVYQNEPYVKARMKMDDGNEIVFAYYHTTQVSANNGVTYQLYAYPDGTDTETGLPLMYCWFVYDS